MQHVVHAVNAVENSDESEQQKTNSIVDHRPPPPLPKSIRKTPTSHVVSDDTRAQINQRVNIDKESVCAVARDLRLVWRTVDRIASAARGVQKKSTYVRLRDATTPKLEGDMPKDPFAGAKPNLRGQKRSLEEKTYLAALVNIKREPANRVARDYGLSARSVGQYASRMLEGLPIHRSVGNPRPAIDDESDQALRELAAKAVGERPSLAEMKRHLQEQINWTQHRRVRAKCPLTETLGAAVDGVVAEHEGEPEEFKVSGPTMRSWLGKYGYGKSVGEI